MYFVIRNVCTCSQECGNGEPTPGHFGLFFTCSPYTLYTTQFNLLDIH